MEINTQEDMDQAKLEYFRYLRGLKDWPEGVDSEKQRAVHIGVSTASLFNWRRVYDWENAEVSWDDYEIWRRDGRAMGGYTRRADLPVGYKTCPKCEGVGEILCHGKEHHMQRSLMWAGSWHGRAVTIPWLKDRETWTRIPGWAMAYVAPGGWGNLKVFISVDVAPNWGGWSGGYMFPNDFELFKGHRLYWRLVKWSGREGVEVYHEPIPELEAVLGMIESPALLEMAGQVA